LAAQPKFASSGESIQLPLPEDLDGYALVKRLGADVARVERLGTSREGRPLDLVSVGRGSHDVLIVGAPHANEPIGCATIVRLLERLAGDRSLREGSGWRWHFIPAIDIDGLALNQAWFRGPLTLARYVEGFYRPPFALQPEYAFPLDVPGYRFDRETPESHCWRLALDHIRPQMQCSLHGADTGGSFFIVSAYRPRLCEELQKLPAANGITLNTSGDTSADLKTFAPGVFSFPDQDAVIARAIAAGKSPATVWDAGDSSAGYSMKRYKTFNMTCEIPLWLDARERDPGDSGKTLADVVDDNIKMARADERLLTPYLPALEETSRTAEARALFASVKDAILQTDGSVDELEGSKADSGSSRVLSYRDLVQYEAGTGMFRTLAMAARLARLSGLGDVEARSRTELAKRIGDFQRQARLTVVSLRSSTALQMSALLATARHLVEGY
jgi:hypothetical protein